MARQGEGSSVAATLTKFFVFEASDDLTVWTYRGEQVARDRAHALRLFYPDGDAAAPQRVAVSENAWRPEPARAARPVMPTVPRAQGWLLDDAFPGTDTE